MCLNMIAHWTCAAVGWPESTTHAANRWVQPIIVAELWRLEVARLGKFLRKFRVFEKSDPLRENFQNFVPERFIATQMDVLCWNFVKFDRREIGKVVSYLPAKKLVWLSRSRFYTDRTHNLPRPAADNFLRYLKNTSKSAHIRRPNAWTPSKGAVKYFQYSAGA